ncbi:MAG: acyl-CoA dehydrogenase [Deltaproteobacteria bacterium]|nr:acyl-CoA dehydrogenase [Deltaproteobacteria bacterium]
MSKTLHYKSNLRDVMFNLFEVLHIERDVLGKGQYANLDEATARDTLQQLETIATNELATSFVEGDRTPLKLDPATGTVTVPEAINRSLKAWFDGGWNLYEVPERLGGIGAPPSMYWAGMELIAGANPVVTFYLFGSFMARVIDGLGTPAQKARYVKPMLDGQWGGTMMLTEANAGSDVGEGTSRAKHVGGDVWELTGNKIFITNGDFDYAKNIVHLVLARPEGAAGGTKGLSLFIVPKFWVKEDGSIGERNGIKVTAIEKKMGIKASATCTMEMGGDVPCRGLLMGEVHDGIRQMFKVIENARMTIGVKSMSTLSSAYLNSLEYARDRVQGPDLTKATDKTSPRVQIIKHPDVRRMLMMQKCYAEGMRALVFHAAHLQDQIELKGGHGSPDARELEKVNDLLLPCIKGFSSEKVYELLGSCSLQVFGGSGFTQDWPIEQYVRDQKIDSLYEGTTHIQALDLIFRKIARDGGQTMMGLLQQVQALAESKEGGDALAAEREALGKALGQLQGIFGVMMPRMGESLYHVGLVANRILFALSEVLIGWQLVKHAAVAHKKLAEAGPDKAYFQGKIASAKFFAKECLPNVALHKKVVESTDLSLMELPEEAF